MPPARVQNSGYKFCLLFLLVSAIIVSVRDKNIRRAARALFMSQGDDKNSILAKQISGDSDHADSVKSLVKDQGRVLVILEKLVLPLGQHSFSEEEMYGLLTSKLEKKGHRIQDDEEEDTPEYAAEKQAAIEARAKLVPDLFGVSVAELEAEKTNDLPDEEENVSAEVPVIEDVWEGSPQDILAEVHGIPMPVVSSTGEKSAGEVVPLTDLDNLSKTALVVLAGIGLYKILKD